MAGFTVDGVDYDWAESYTLGDSVLIRAVSGMDMEEFGELLADAQEDDSPARRDPRLLVAMVAVGIWRKHRRWPLDRVAQFALSIDFERFEIALPEEPEEDDAGPPAVGESVAAEEPVAVSPPSVEPSNGRPASESAEPIPTPTGSLA